MAVGGDKAKRARKKAAREAAARAAMETSGGPIEGMVTKEVDQSDMKTQVTRILVDSAADPAAVAKDIVEALSPAKETEVAEEEASAPAPKKTTKKSAKGDSSKEAS